MTTEIKEIKELKAKLEAREKSIKNLSEWIIEMGTYAGVDIQRDFDGIFDEDFIQEVATCLEDDILGSKFNLERQDEVIEKQDKVIKAQKEMIHNSNLIITMLAKQLETKYNDELGKAYLDAK
ncbi:hypothetical protein [Bacillus thuringiensis]|uniref:hypothetical protein n=1 Tax=Bacillus thuringiensis TaxID=1428 RepID=UPI0021001DA8|nr:hypothetical protein [Bacillus thuringiensis]